MGGGGGVYDSLMMTMRMPKQINGDCLEHDGDADTRYDGGAAKEQENTLSTAEHQRYSLMFVDRG